MPALRLDILALTPVLYRQCSACETIYNQAGMRDATQHQLLQEYPPEVLDDHARLSAWIRALWEAYGDRLDVRLVDPQSLAGIWKSLVHGVRRYPTFILAGREKYTGWDQDALHQMIQRRLGES
jgi:hypothetical protein